MAGAIFELEGVSGLPLWAHVLIASRMARRAAYHLPSDVPDETQAALIAGCDAIDRCAAAGDWLSSEKPTIARAKDLSVGLGAEAARQAFYYAADATHAAQSSLDFSAAETACVSSAQKAIAWASEAPGLSPLQVRIFLAADFDLLRFACRESSVGRYDGLGAAVMGRLAPVYPPDERPMPIDTTPEDPR